MDSHRCPHTQRASPSIPGLLRSPLKRRRKVDSPSNNSVEDGQLSPKRGTPDISAALLTPKGDVPLTATTPMSDFQNFAENLLSPLTPPQDVTLPNRVPTSRDWASYQGQIHGSNNFSADFVSTKKRSSDNITQYSPIELSMGSSVMNSTGLLGESCLDDFVRSEGVVSIDNFSQAQLISNAQALASRLNKNRANSTDRQSTRNERSDQIVQNVDKKNGRRKRKFCSNKEPEVPSEMSQVAPLTADEVGLAFKPHSNNDDTSFSGSFVVGKAVYDHTIQQPHPAMGVSTPYARHQDGQLLDSMLQQKAGADKRAVPSYATENKSNIITSTGHTSDPNHDDGSLRSPPQLGYQNAVLCCAGQSPLSIKQTEAPNISPAVAHITNRTVSCNCKKSRCLKLYCDCFRAQKYCDGCNCQQCFNSPEYESERQRSMISITERNPEAFMPRITSDSPNKRVIQGDVIPETESISPSVQYHFSGCHCKKSACLKKYCECYQAQVPCQARCRCQDCKNTIADNVFSDASKSTVSRSGYVVDTNGGQFSSQRNVPNSLVQGLVRAAGGVVTSHKYPELPAPDSDRKPLLKRLDDLKNRNFVTGSGLLDRNRDNLRKPPLPVPSPLQRGVAPTTTPVLNKEGISPLSDDTSPSSTTNSMYTKSSTSVTSSGICVSNISLDLLSTALAARLKNIERGVESGISTEDCIREELLRMQEQGVLIPAQGPP